MSTPVKPKAPRRAARFRRCACGLLAHTHTTGAPVCDRCRRIELRMAHETHRGEGRRREEPKILSVQTNGNNTPR